MAEINIKIWDEDGDIRMSCESNPPFKGLKRFEENTNAQLIALDFFSNSLNEAEKVHSLKADGKEIDY